MSTRGIAVTKDKPIDAVFISGQKREVFGVIKRELRRRSAVEPVIALMKTDGRLGRRYLKGHAGDAANVVLTAVGHNLRHALAWTEASPVLNPSNRDCLPSQPRPNGLLKDDQSILVAESTMEYPRRP